MSEAPAIDAPVAGKREATKAANRAAILAAARMVFADIGFGAASVRDIIRRTDLAREIKAGEQRAKARGFALPVPPRAGAEAEPAAA